MKLELELSMEWTPAHVMSIAEILLAEKARDSTGFVDMYFEKGKEQHWDDESVFHSHTYRLRILDSAISMFQMQLLSFTVLKKVINSPTDKTIASYPQYRGPLLILRLNLLSLSKASGRRN